MMPAQARESMNGINTVAAEVAETGTFEVERISTEEGFASIGSEWNALVDRSSASIYQSYEWQSLWWKYLGRPGGHMLHILLIRSGEDLVGIAPLFLQAERFGGRVIHRRLRFLGSGESFGKSNGLFQDDGPSDYLDLIAQKGYEEQVAIAFLEHFRAASDAFDLLEAVNLPQHGVMMNFVVPQLAARSMRFSISRGEICSRIPLPGTTEEYMRSLSSSVRRRLSQARKALRAGQDLTLTSIDSADALESAFEQLVTLHQNRWMNLGYPGLFSEERFRQFQFAVARAFFESKKLWFKTVHHNGICVAARLGFTSNGCIYDYLTGFDHLSPSAKQRPGLGLLLSMIEDAISSGLHSVDLLRGNEDYKVELTSVADHNWNLVVPADKRTRLSERLRHSVLRTVRMVAFMHFKELALLRVQYRLHNAVTCIPFYLRFRMQRLIHRIRSREK